MELTLREDVAPVVASPTGNLLDAGVQTGVRALTYAASDSQSGISKVEALLGETVVASRDVTAQCSYSDFTVCPDAQSETLQIDTRAVANGPHRLAMRVRDAAGNERLTHVETPVHVFNEAAPTAGSTESDAVQVYGLSASFKGTSRSTLTVPYGQRVVVRGRLTQNLQPVARDQ